jgi:hypothetical protein
MALLLLACGNSSSGGPGSADAGTGGGGGVDGSISATGGSGGQPSADGAMVEAGMPSDASASDGDVSDGGDSDGPRDGGASDSGVADGPRDGGASDGGAPAPLRVWPLGDSITFGYNGANAGYRGPLYNLLKSAAPGWLYVGTSVEGVVTATVDPLPASQSHNEGHGSYAINDINNNLDGLDATEFNLYGETYRDPNGGHWLDGIASGAHARPALYPDIILLMIGTNNANDADRTAVRDQLHALITKITTMRPDAKLIIAQITPSNRPNNVSYNATVASEVQSFRAVGKQVSLVDMYTNFPADGLYSDGVHHGAAMARRHRRRDAHAEGAVSAGYRAGL